MRTHFIERRQVCVHSFSVRHGYKPTMECPFCGGTGFVAARVPLLPLIGQEENNDVR